MTGELWNAESDEVRAHFAKLAAEEKERHAGKYPGYTYMPKQQEDGASTVRQRSGKNTRRSGKRKYADDDDDEDDDEEDEDDIEAHEASIQRLKEADEHTRDMTREQYQHYSDCRQASFTYRKGEDTYIFHCRPN